MRINGQTVLRFTGIGAIFLAGTASRLANAQSTSSAPPAAEPDGPGASHAATTLLKPEPKDDGWLFPVTKLDESLPRWIQFGAQFRDRAESQDGLGYAPVNDTYDLTQLRLGVYIQPTKWFKVPAVTQDSRVFFNQHVADKPPYQNIWDIREAYAQLGSSDEGWFDVLAGREMLSFGDERVIGPSDWLNMGRTFDTVRMDVHPPGVKVSIFASSVIVARDGVVDHHFEGNNLYGIYGAFNRLIRHASVEPYVLWRVAPANIRLAENAGLGPLDEVTIGIRVAGTAAALDYDVEMNKQTGSLGPKSIDAWAGHWNVGYEFGSAHLNPRVFAEYDYASGNRNPAGNTWGTHDQLYPSAHNKMDFADQFGWKNIEDLRLGVDEKINKRWTLTEIFNDIWLATTHDGLYNTAGAISIAAHPNANSNHVGTELDLIGEYKQNTHVSYGFGWAHLFSGTFLNEASKGKDYNYPFAYATYIF